MQEHDASEIIQGLLDFVFSSSKCTRPEESRQMQWRVSIGYRRFVALAFIMRPASIAPGLPAWKLAEALGITPARFSQLCHAISDQLGGLKAPSMRSDAHRRACSDSRMGVKPDLTARRTRNTNVSQQPANRYRISEQKGITTALDAFARGKAWTKPQVRLLFCAGLVDADGGLTDKGIGAMRERGGKVSA